MTTAAQIKKLDDSMAKYFGAPGQNPPPPPPPPPTHHSGPFGDRTNRNQGQKKRGASIERSVQSMNARTKASSLFVKNDESFSNESSIKVELHAYTKEKLLFSCRVDPFLELQNSRKSEFSLIFSKQNRSVIF